MCVVGWGSRLHKREEEAEHKHSSFSAFELQMQCSQVPQAPAPDFPTMMHDGVLCLLKVESEITSLPPVASYQVFRKVNDTVFVRACY